MEIRARRPPDLEPLLALTLRVKRHDGYPSRGPIDIDRFLSPPQELAAWVAEVDATVAGHVALHRTDLGDTVALAARHTARDPETLAVVSRVLVSPTARRRGVGRSLLATAVRDAHQRDRQPVLEVGVHHDAAIGLYESCGWERVGEVTLQLDGEPSLRRYVYVGPAPDGPDPELTRR